MGKRLLRSLRKKLICVGYAMKLLYCVLCIPISCITIWKIKKSEYKDLIYKTSQNILKLSTHRLNCKLDYQVTLS